MLERIRYRFLMRKMRKEIARLSDDGRSYTEKRNTEKEKRAVMTACKACGSIV